MSNFLIGILLLTVSVFVGLKFGRKYKRKKEFYFSYCAFLSDYITELSFGKATLPEFFGRKYPSEQFNGILSDKKENKNVTFPDYLGSDEKYEIQTFFLEIGKYDAQSEKRLAEGALKRAEAVRQNSEKECSNKYPVYLRTGVAVGLILLIIVL